MNNMTDFDMALAAIRWHLIVQTILLCVILASHLAMALKVYLIWRRATRSRQS